MALIIRTLMYLVTELGKLRVEAELMKHHLDWYAKDEMDRNIDRIVAEVKDEMDNLRRYQQ